MRFEIKVGEEKAARMTAADLGKCEIGMVLAKSYDAEYVPESEVCIRAHDDKALLYPCGEHARAANLTVRKLLPGEKVTITVKS